MGRAPAGEAVVSAARYVVRVGTGYACASCGSPACLLVVEDREPCSKAVAVKLAKRRGGRVVRLLSPAEQADRAGARALRAVAHEYAADQTWSIVSRDLHRRADRLWPRKVKP